MQQHDISDRPQNSPLFLKQDLEVSEINQEPIGVGAYLDYVHSENLEDSDFDSSVKYLEDLDPTDPVKRAGSK